MDKEEKERRLAFINEMEIKNNVGSKVRELVARKPVKEYMEDEHGIVEEEECQEPIYSEPKPQSVFGKIGEWSMKSGLLDLCIGYQIGKNFLKDIMPPETPKKKLPFWR